MLGFWLLPLLCAYSEEPIASAQVQQPSPLMQRYLHYGQLYGTSSLLQAGVESFEAREYDVARVAFGALSMLDCKSVEAAYYLGKVAYELGDLDGAKQSFRAAFQRLGPAPKTDVSNDSSVSFTVASSSPTSAQRPASPSPLALARGKANGAWVSVTGKPFKLANQDATGIPALVKLPTTGVQILAEDGWALAPSSRSYGSDAVYSLLPGKQYRLQVNASRGNNAPLYLGALGATLLVLFLAN